MTAFIIQSLLLIAVAFILGCLLGSFLRYLFSPAPQAAMANAPVSTQASPARTSFVGQSDAQPASKDNLQEISGIGPVLEKKLNNFGVFRFEQIANWTKQDIAEFDERLDFKGRIEREEWIQQAKKLV